MPNDDHSHLTKSERRELKRKQKQERRDQEEQSKATAKSKKNIKLYGGVAIIIVLLAFGGYRLASSASEAPGGLFQIGPPGSTHIHTDFAFFLNGQKMDFSNARYFVHTAEVHLHQPYSSLIHIHATGVPFGMFLDKDLKFELSAECLTIDTGESYCNDEENTLKTYVNGATVADLNTYVMRQGDKILISYGSETEEELQAQFISVGSLSAEAAAGRIAG